MNWTERIHTSISKSRKVPGGNLIQLATVDSASRPHNRTIVFRGFSKLQGRKALRAVSNLHAEKIKHLRQNPRAEICWWFSQSREQFRFSGTVRLVGAEEVDEELAGIRLQQWKDMSDPGREMFFWPNPRQPAPADAQFEGVPKGGRSEEAGKILDPPESFVVLLLWPDGVKYLDLKTNFAQEDELLQPSAAEKIQLDGKDPERATTIHTKEGEREVWKSTRVIP